jgi:hypothetical protein
MSAILTTILALIEQLVPASTSAALIEKIIAVLIQLIPVIVQEYKDLLPIVQNIITALKSDPSTTAQQLATLEELEIQYDADFEAAAAAAQAEDSAST